MPCLLNNLFLGSSPEFIRQAPSNVPNVSGASTSTVVITDVTDEDPPVGTGDQAEDAQPEVEISQENSDPSANILELPDLEESLLADDDEAMDISALF